MKSGGQGNCHELQVRLGCVMSSRRAYVTGWHTDTLSQRVKEQQKKKYKQSGRPKVICIKKGPAMQSGDI